MQSASLYRREWGSSPPSGRAAAKAVSERALGQKQKLRASVAEARAGWAGGLVMHMAFPWI